MIVVFAQMADNPFINQILIACIGAAVSGLVFIIGFVAVYRRFADKEIPAQLASINNKFASLDAHVDTIGKELISMRLEIAKHGYQIQSLEQWRDRTSDLDDTRSGNRPRTPRQR
jgi:sugar phosphate permease